MRKRPLLFPFVFLALLLSASNGTAQSVTTHISADSLRAGDLVTLSIALSKDKQYDKIIFPDSANFRRNFELRRRQHFSVTDFKDSLVYQIQFWGVKNDTIPPMPVKLVSENDTTVIFTQPISVTFQSVIQDETPELRPLKPIFEFARAWWLYLLIILLLLLVAAAAWYYYKKREEQPEPVEPPEFKPEPFLNPLRELENNLRQLKDIPKSGKENFKQFYIDLGDAIRLYFEQMYHIPALESTSTEIINDLNNRAVDDRLVEDTRTVLNEADMVKFAKFRPTEQQAEKAYQKAENFHQTVHELHQQKIEMLRKQHFKRVEEQRAAFYESQKEEVQV